MDQTNLLWQQSQYLDQGAEVFALLGLAAVIVLPMILAVLDLRRLDHPFRRLLYLALITTAVVQFHVVDWLISDARVMALEKLQRSACCDSSISMSVENGILVTQAVGQVAEWAFMIVAVIAVLRVFARSEDRLNSGR
jgi:hypothetical protein